MKSDIGQTIPFSEFLDNFGVKLSFEVFVTFQASILGFEVFSLAPDPWVLDPIGDPVKTWADWDPELNPLTPEQLAAMWANPTPAATAVRPFFDTSYVRNSGASTLTNLKVKPKPNLMIDGPGGDALYLQVADDGSGKANLAYARRSGGTWDPITVLAQDEHVLNPAAAFTNDGPGTPAVVVYQAAPLSAGMTIDQFLNGQDIRWRYHDGSAWGPEQVLTSDDKFDGDPAVAFNSAGQGLVAWTHNSFETPLNSPNYNEIMVTRWDSTTHTWLSPVQLTSNAIGDAQPAVFAAEDGALTVVWLRGADSAVGSEVWFSQYLGGAWSAPALLPILGLPDVGSITELAIGSSGADAAGRQRPDVVLAHSITKLDVDPDLANGGATPMQSQLLHPPPGLTRSRRRPPCRPWRRTPISLICTRWPTPTAACSRTGNKVTASSRRILRRTWGNLARAKWSRPMQLVGALFELAPALAFDTEGTDTVLQLVFEGSSRSPSRARLRSPAAVEQRRSAIGHGQRHDGGAAAGAGLLARVGFPQSGRGADRHARDRRGNRRQPRPGRHASPRRLLDRRLARPLRNPDALPQSR